MRGGSGRVTTWVGGALWIGALALGLMALMRTESVAGGFGDVPMAWPDASGLPW